MTEERGDTTGETVSERDSVQGLSLLRTITDNQSNGGCQTMLQTDTEMKES